MDKFIQIWGEFNFSLETYNTLLMTIVPLVFAYIIGLPLGILCVISDKNGIRPNKIANNILNVVVNLGRSIPFIILLVMLIPFTRLLLNTAIGPWAASVPLTIACIPFIARVVEQSLKEVDQGVIDASISMGATDFQIITRVYLVETIPSLIRGVAISAIALVGYTAMAGAVGAGGLGHIAINQGFFRNNMSVAFIACILIVVIVQVIQISLEFTAKKVDKKNIK